MKKKVIGMIAGFAIFYIVLSLAIGLYFSNCNRMSIDDRNQLVILNEIEKLTEDENGENPAAEQITLLKEQLQDSGTEEYDIAGIQQMILACGVLTLLFLLVVFTYIYCKILRPFERLERYAGEVAKGNLDVELNYERTNLFGAFTWAFDHMREEILKARRNEAAAIEENKTIIATLSHDIKTPIASITAYAEALEAGMDSSYEVRQRYTDTIMRKCEEVTRLTNDLVLHSLSELDKLEITNEEHEIRDSLHSIMNDLQFPLVRQVGELPQAVLLYDEKRLAQVIENLFNNAKKYATGCEVELSACIRNQQYEIHVRDHGAGIPAQDMPFLFDKFYRGKNAGDNPGSGLGLYIVKYIMNAMNGDVSALNHEDGLDVVVWLPMKK